MQNIRSFFFYYKIILVVTYHKEIYCLNGYADYYANEYEDKYTR